MYRRSIFVLSACVLLFLPHRQTTAQFNISVDWGTCYDYTFTRSCEQIAINEWPEGVLRVDCSGCEQRSTPNNGDWWECTQREGRWKQIAWTQGSMNQISEVDSGGYHGFPQQLPGQWVDPQFVACTEWWECETECVVEGVDGDGNPPPPTVLQALDWWVLGTALPHTLRIM